MPRIRPYKSVSRIPPDYAISTINPEEPNPEEPKRFAGEQESLLVIEREIRALDDWIFQNLTDEDDDPAEGFETASLGNLVERPGRSIFDDIDAE